MRFATAALVTVLVLSSACSWERKVKKLGPDEFDTYYALRPFMSEEVRKTYLKTKTPEARAQYLKDEKLWDVFYKYTEAERDAIIAGDVAVGWAKDMVIMAWGKPYDIRKLVGRKAMRSELMVYRFEVADDGRILVWEPGSKTAYRSVRRFERLVTVDDDRVTTIEEREDWSQGQ